MKTFLTIVGGIAGFAAILAFGFGMNVLGMFSKDFFGTWNEQIRYDIHKESQAHRDGLQLNLANMQTEFLNADAAGKAAIAASIRHQYSQADTSEFPAHLKSFLSELGIY